MAFTSTQVVSNNNDVSGTVLTADITLGGAGELVLVWFRHEGTALTAADYSCTVGGDATVKGPIVDHSNLDMHAITFYVLACSAATFTVTVTLAAARPFRGMHVRKFAYTGTASFDAQNTGSGGAADLNPRSGNITTTGTDEVVIGTFSKYSSVTFTAPRVNAVAADNSLIDTMASWYRILTATFANGNADGTVDLGTDWIVYATAFKAVAAAPPSGLPPMLSRHLEPVMPHNPGLLVRL